MNEYNLKKQAYIDACYDMADKISLISVTSCGISLDDAPQLVIKLRSMVYQLSEDYEQKYGESK